ncbi:MAG TPA: cobalamin-binding protein, partial [Bacteroidota bacterium]|nr:cobalamin-binding protein [Bacteroidota bacterium]
AYSRGPISITSRIDTVRAVTDAFRFMGDAQIAPSAKAKAYTDEILEKVTQVLREVAGQPTLHEAISMGLLGNEQDGAYPGTFGNNTVRQR